MFVPSEIFHVVVRGQSHSPMFGTNAAREQLNQLISDTFGGYPACVHAFCWMDREAQLAVETFSYPIRALLRRLSNLHSARQKSAIANGVPPLDFSVRAAPLEGEGELLDCVRLIHLAPVRAGYAIDAADYRWSSHRAYLGLETVPWLTTDVVLESFVEESGRALQGYSEYIRHGYLKKRLVSEPVERTKAALGPKAPVANRAARDDNSSEQTGA